MPIVPKPKKDEQPLNIPIGWVMDKPSRQAPWFVGYILLLQEMLEHELLVSTVDGDPMGATILAANLLRRLPSEVALDAVVQRVSALLPLTRIQEGALESEEHKEAILALVMTMIVDLLKFLECSRRENPDDQKTPDIKP